MKEIKGFKIDNEEIKILCYADIAILTAENELTKTGSQIQRSSKEAKLGHFNQENENTGHQQRTDQI